MQRILVIEDDEAILMGLKDNLEIEGYEVILAKDGEKGLALAREKRPDLIILDIMLPKHNGYYVCKTLKIEKIDIPIIVLSAKGQVADRVLGLELGADDYVTKPFSLRELLSRVTAVLRRSEQKERGEVRTYSFGPFRLDFKRYEAFKKEKRLKLTPLEFKVLKLLIERRGEVVSRADFLDKVWGYDVFPTTRTVDTHIAHIRKIIEDDPQKPKYILNVRGLGYKFTG